MGIFGKYVEVYATLKMEDFFRAKNILSDHGIAFQDTSANRQLGLSFNNVRGDQMAFSRDGFVKTRYCISVKKEDEGRARKVLKDLFAS